MSTPPVARPYRPSTHLASVLVASATASTGFAVWLDVRMAEADETPVDVAPLTAFGVVLALALTTAIIAATGNDPIAAYLNIAQGAVGSPNVAANVARSNR